MKNKKINNRVQINDKDEQQPVAEEKKTDLKRFQNKYVLLLKLFFVLFVVGCCIHYTDEEGYFNPDKEGAPKATYKRWDSFYDLTKKDSVDILILGNSHANHSINPKNLSAALGNISFVLAQNGTDLSDAYFNLEEALTLTKPKLCIVEPFGCINEKEVKKRARLVSRSLAFSARKNTKLKIFSMPDLFVYDDYLAAWSPTVRNHEFYFRDTARISRNILLKKKPYLATKVAFDTIPLYLGRMVRFQQGLSDSILNKYKTEGPSIVCSDTGGFAFSYDAEYYFRKISDLCKKNDIPLLFLTVPVYYKHIGNYQLWHDKMAKFIEPTGAKWYDMQLENDTVSYGPSCFENTYDFNQHITYFGSIITTYKLAKYIHDSLDVNLPIRYDSPKWNDMFYGQEGYFFNCLPNKSDTLRHLISKDQQFGALHVKGVFWENQKTTNRLMVMVDKNDSITGANQLVLVLRGKLKNQMVPAASLPVSKVSDVNPVCHDLYMANVLKDFEPDSILNVVEVRR